MDNSNDTSPSRAGHKRWIDYALILISRQLRSVEHKLNKLLEKSGEDAQILKLSKMLGDETDALQTAIDNQHLPGGIPGPKPITPKQKENKP
jgi:hypothetical protein